MLPRTSWRNPRASPSTRFQVEMFSDDCARNEPWLNFPQLRYERWITIFSSLFQRLAALCDRSQPLPMSGVNFHTVWRRLFGSQANWWSLGYRVELAALEPIDRGVLHQSLAPTWPELKKDRSDGCLRLFRMS